ncbi:hypothetical protein [Agrobacterium tumefaciens]|uniref:hypothetical protein n=1 Tax=Agrobacterium tumefaciens TaxID=358 RepID=UPI0015C38311
MVTSNPTLPEITDGYETKLHHALGHDLGTGAGAVSGATYITPNVALLIGWAGGKVGILELLAIILV